MTQMPSGPPIKSGQIWKAEPNRDFPTLHFEEAFVLVLSSPDMNDFLSTFRVLHDTGVYDTFTQTYLYRYYSLLMET